MVVARYLRIKGRVQGVGYRAWVQATAKEIGLTGWVRNCSDGTVEAVAEGDAEKVHAFIEAAWRGPSLSRVSDIIVENVGISRLSSFAIRPTG